MHRLVWLPLNLLQLVVIVLWTTFWIVGALLVLLFTRRAELPLLMARTVWAPGILRLLMIRVEVQSEHPIDESQSYFFISNHQSALDIPILFQSIPMPIRFVAKSELFRIPFLGWYMRATGMVPIDRTRPERSARALSQSERPAQTGSLLGFPEGTRSHGGPIGTFQRGAIALAIRLGMPIVPVAIEGSGRCLHRSGVSCLPGQIQVMFGAPISTEGWTRERRAELSERVESEVRRLHRTLLDQPRR